MSRRNYRLRRVHVYTTHGPRGSGSYTTPIPDSSSGARARGRALQAAYRYRRQQAIRYAISHMPSIYPRAYRGRLWNRWL